MSDRAGQLEEIYAALTDRRTALWLRVREAATIGDKARADSAMLEILDNQALNLAHLIVVAYGDGGSDAPQF